MRPVLVAMNNPVSSDPRHALYPAPEGCAGHRLWRMLDDYAQRHGYGVGRMHYVNAFDRRNVLSAKVWSERDAREAGRQLAPALSGRRVVVLGVGTARALGLDRYDWGWWLHVVHSDLLDPALSFDLDYCVLPHPSGRCREYNDPAMRELAGKTLYDLYAAALG